MYKCDRAFITSKMTFIGVCSTEQNKRRKVKPWLSELLIVKDLRDTILACMSKVRCLQAFFQDWNTFFYDIFIKSTPVLNFCNFSHLNRLSVCAKLLCYIHDAACLTVWYHLTDWMRL